MSTFNVLLSAPHVESTLWNHRAHTTPSNGPETARNPHTLASVHREHNLIGAEKLSVCVFICHYVRSTILIASFLPLLLSAISPDLISD